MSIVITKPGRSLLFLGIFLVAAFLAFANSLQNPFLIDDHAFFDEKLKNPKFIWLNFLPDKNKILHIEGEAADPFYRPLSTIVPMFMHLAFRTDAGSYHVANTVLWGLAAWVIFLFLRRWGISEMTACLAALFYLIHPINGVVVNYITASVFAVQIILMLGALYFLDSRFRGNDIVKRTLSCFFYILAMMCHETAMALPAYALLLFWVQKPTLAGFKEAFSKTLPLWVTFGVYLLWRMSHSSLDASIIDKIGRYDMNFFQYLATWTMLLVWYVSRLFYPEGIVLIMAHQPLKDFGPVAGWCAVLLVLLAAIPLLAYAFRNNRLMLLGWGWFVAGFAPFTMACFFQPIHGLMIEPHWFLFPVIGFFMIMAGLFEQGLKSRPLQAKVVIGIAAFVCLAMGWRHNYLWADEVRYCNWWLKQSPAFVAVNAYIAKAYELRGENDQAREHYQVILNRGYKDEIAYSNMGLMDMKEGKWASARQNFLHALKNDPYASIPICNLGVVEFQEAKYDKAMEYFQQCKELDRFSMLARLDISKTYLQLKDPKKAAQELEEALHIVPYHEIALVDLIQIYLEQKNLPETLKVAQWILERSRNPNALNNVAIIFKQQGMLTQSQAAYQKSLKYVK